MTLEKHVFFVCDEMVHVWLGHVREGPLLNVTKGSTRQLQQQHQELGWGVSPSGSSTSFSTGGVSPLPPQQHGYLTPGPSSHAERALQDPSAHVRRQMSAPAAVRRGTGPGGSRWEDGGTRAPRAASPHASRSPGVHVEGVAAGAQGYGAPTPASLGLLPSPHTRSTAASSPVTHTRGDAVSSIVRLA